MSLSNTLRTAKLTAAIDHFQMKLQVANYSKCSVDAYRYRLHYLAEWCKERGIETVAELTIEALQGYRRYLFHKINPKSGKQLLPRSQSQHVVMIRCFCKWLRENDAIDFNAEKYLPLPIIPRRQLADVMSVDEVQRTAIGSRPDESTGHPRPSHPGNVLLNGDPSYRAITTLRRRRGRIEKTGSCPRR